MHYTYRPKNVCSTKIEFDVDNGIISNLRYENGCNGNLKALGALVEGMNVCEVHKRLRGIRCGNNTTSCSDQLARALEENGVITE